MENLKIKKAKLHKERIQLNRLSKSLDKKQWLYESLHQVFSGKRTKELVKHPKKKLIKDLDVVFMADIHHLGGESSNLIVDNFFKNVESLTKSYSLVIPGDLIQGKLHNDDYITNNKKTMQQTLELTNCLIKNIRKSSIKNIIILPGNHDEIRLNGMNVKGANNEYFAEVVFAILQKEFPNIPMRYEEQEYEFKLNGTYYKVIHGHIERSKVVMKKVADRYNGILIHAHLHHFYASGNMIGLPALSQPNLYEKSLGLEDNEPSYMILYSNGAIGVYKVGKGRNGR